MNTEPKTDAQKVAARWVEEINLAEKDCASWWRSGDIIIRRYKNDDRSGRGRAIIAGRRRYAILWSNVQTLGPAIYAKSPVPNVSRRFKDEDPVGKVAADVLERALTYTVDCQSFDERMIQVRSDYLLPGRGQVWLRYVPTMEQINPEADPEEGEGIEDDDQNDDPQEPMEAVSYEETLVDHVAWKDYLTNPCREEAEVRWKARRVFMNKKECIKRFGDKVGPKIPMDGQATGTDTGDISIDVDQDQLQKKATIYEIWDKPTRTVFWISKGYQGGPLDTREDPLKLSGFFPCPAPMCATVASDSTLPVPDYVLYQDQAEELDELTARIAKLQDALRMVGVYAGENNVMLQNVFAPGNENKLIPVDTYDLFKEKGGVKGIIEWFPIDMVIQCLQGCYEARGQVINDIYQITGLSDIIRGESDPNTTATAEKIKGQWGSLRVRDRQKDMQRFSRDIIRIMGEIISEHFSVETLKAMTGVKLLTNEEKQTAQQAMQVAQQAQQLGIQVPPPDPKIMALLEQPSWEDVTGLLKNDKLRSFRIDIETDSTIEPDENAAKQAFVEYVGAISQLLTTAAPIVGAQPQTAPLFAEIMKQSARVFDVPRSMEDVIDKVFGQLEQMPPQTAGPEQPPPPSPLDEAKAQAEIASAQNEQQRTQMDGMIAQSDAQLAQADLALKAEELNLKRIAIERDPEPQGTA